MDMENTFAKKVQKAMGSAIPDWIPRGKWRGVSYGHILTDMRNNFIDGCYPVKCCIKGNLSEGEIKYHQGASHLNSSQVMCINFFKKFFEKEEYEGYLLAVLCKLRSNGMPVPLLRNGYSIFNGTKYR